MIANNNNNLLLGRGSGLSHQEGRFFGPYSDDKMSQSSHVSSEGTNNCGSGRGRGRGGRGRGRGATIVQNTKLTGTAFTAEHETRVDMNILAKTMGITISDLHQKLKLTGKKEIPDYFVYFHHFWDYSETNRKDVAQKFSLIFESYKAHKNIVQLKNDVISSIINSLDKRRLTVLSIQYLVCIGGFHEILNSNHIFKAVLEGCLVFDIKVEKGSTPYLYTINKLTRGDIPDVRFTELITNYRKVLNYDVSIAKTIEIIDKIQNSLQEKIVQVTDHIKSFEHQICSKCKMMIKNHNCTSKIPAGSIPLCQRDKFPFICRCQNKVPESASTKENIVPVFGEKVNDGSLLTNDTTQTKSKISLFDNLNTNRIPITRDECIQYLKEYKKSNGGQIIPDEKFFKENLVVQNTKIWYQIFFALYQYQGIESMFKVQGKSNVEKKALIEQSMSALLDTKEFIGTELEPTKEHAKTMIRWVIDNISYHPIGAFDGEKHFNLYEKLEEIKEEQNVDKKIEEFANIMIDEIKNYKVSNSLEKAMSDFYSRKLNYGYLGFQDFHYHLWSNGESMIKYIASFFKEIENIAFLRSFIKNFVNKFHNINESRQYVYVSFMEKLQNEAEKLKQEQIKIISEIQEINTQKEKKIKDNERQEKEAQMKFKTEEIENISSVLNFIYSEISKSNIFVDYTEKRIDGTFDNNCFDVFKTKFNDIMNKAIRKIDKNTNIQIQNPDEEFFAFYKKIQHNFSNEIFVKMIITFIKDLATVMSDGDDELFGDITKTLHEEIYNKLRKEIKNATQEIKTLLNQKNNVIGLSQIKRDLKNYSNDMKHLFSVLYNFNSNEFNGKQKTKELENDCLAFSSDASSNSSNNSDKEELEE